MPCRAYAQRPCALLLCLFFLSSSCGKPPCPAENPCSCSSLRFKCLQPSDETFLTTIARVPYIMPASLGDYWSFEFHELRIRNQAMTNLTLEYRYGILKVKNVEVSHSLVRYIMPNAFRGFNYIENLNLSYNLLTHLNYGDLYDLPYLRQLNLHHNNLRVIDPAAFDANPSIFQLYLSHNELEEVPTGILKLSQLSHLYLQYNGISVIRNYTFEGLHKLIIVDLSSLRRKLKIEANAFCGTTPPSDPKSKPSSVIGFSRDQGLHALYLRNNFIETLDLCALGKIRNLKALNLTSTYFLCTCQVHTMQDTSLWSDIYGFSPRYLSFDAKHVDTCNPECPSPVVCPDTCPYRIQRPVHRVTGNRFGNRYMIVGDDDKDVKGASSPFGVSSALRLILVTLSFCAFKISLS